MSHSKPKLIKVLIVEPGKAPHRVTPWPFPEGEQKNIDLPCCM